MDLYKLIYKSEVIISRFTVVTSCECIKKNGDDEADKTLTDLAVLADGINGTERVSGTCDVAVPPDLLQLAHSGNYS